MRKFLVCFLFVSQCVSATEYGRDLPSNFINQFFSTLPGAWDGQAIETPVGPVDYELYFHQCGEGVAAGVAELGVSDHYWRFWQFNGELRLTFMSTFRGNQEPTQLKTDKIVENTIQFYAPELALLTLTVTLDDPIIDIRVFHHQKPHVHIRLTSRDEQMTEYEREESMTKNCKEL